jgi:antitoxin Phd
MFIYIGVMLVNTKQIITVSAANQNFSKATRLAEKVGTAVIFKNNLPKYLLVDINNESYLELTDDEKIDIVARRVLNKRRNAFKVLTND